MEGLSPATWQIVQRLFPLQQQQEAGLLLITECGNNLPFLKSQDEYGLERVRFAALKVSRGSLEELLEAIILAQEDWRDLLRAAGFSKSVEMHKVWQQEQDAS